MTSLLLTFALLATVPHGETVLRDRACCLEVNNFHDSEGQLVFKQLLVWEFRRGTHRIIDWRLIKNRGELGTNIEVRRDYQTGDYVARWWEENGGEREVRAKTARETWTQVDPELRDRDAHPVNQRRKLIQGGKP
jgi:hypothetical protein